MRSESVRPFILYFRDFSKFGVRLGFDFGPYGPYFFYIGQAAQYVAKFPT